MTLSEQCRNSDKFNFILYRESDLLIKCVNNYYVKRKGCQEIEFCSFWGFFTVQSHCAITKNGRRWAFGNAKMMTRWSSLCSILHCSADTFHKKCNKLTSVYEYVGHLIHKKYPDFSTFWRPSLIWRWLLNYCPEGGGCWIFQRKSYRQSDWMGLSSGI